MEIKNDIIDFTITIPSDWKVIPREVFEENKIDKRTLFLFLTSDNKYVSFMYQCKLKEENFLNLYKDNIETLKNDGMKVLYEGALTTNGKVKLIKYAFVSINLNDKNLRLMQIFFLYNDYFINVSSEINPNIDPKNILNLMDDKDVITLLKVALSIK